MRIYYCLLCLVVVLFGACIGTDIVDDAVPVELRIAALPDTIAYGDTVELQATYFNNIGRETPAAIVWTSANSDIFRITTRGQGIGVATGQTSLTATTTAADGSTVTAVSQIIVGAETVTVARERTGTIRTTSSYELKGSFTIKQDGNDLLVEIGSDYSASTSLPGLYFYLTNNPRTTDGAEEVGRVAVFSGAHSYRIPNTMLDDFSHLLYFCKPFNVKVGDGKIED